MGKGVKYRGLFEYYLSLRIMFINDVQTAKRIEHKDGYRKIIKKLTVCGVCEGGGGQG